MTNLNMEYELLIRRAYQTNAHTIEYGSQSAYDTLLSLESKVKTHPGDEDLFEEYQEQLNNIKVTIDIALDHMMSRANDENVLNELTNHKIDINLAKNADKISAVIPLAKKIGDNLN
jgi:hypothetical protein